jgi:UDP-GlcNAc:undecaprenyl-phosphate GlcNAc-1-phosphate transferase
MFAEPRECPPACPLSCALLILLGALPRHSSFWDKLTDHPEVLWAALVALVIVVLLTPAVGGMARLLGVVDKPGGRRLHTRPIPRLGGLALFLGVIVPALAFLKLNSEARGILLGAAVATTVGAIDDFRGLRPWEKLGGQIAAAAIPVGFGIWIDHFTLPVIGVHSISGWVGKPLTVVWIVAIMNMVNFLDGLDGLAAGVCAIAGGTFSVIALSLEQWNAAIMSACVLGACVGFLRHNFYPARIFMGDSGSNLLGFVLATVSVSGLLKTAATVALALPLLVLAVPILDTGFVIAKRLKYKRPITSADRWHLHYRFLNIGFSVRRATVTIWLWCCTLAAAALGTRFIPFHAHGHWHTGSSIFAALVGALAIATSIYVVYELEIVKLANPRIRRREAEQRAAEQRERERQTA